MSLKKIQVLQISFFAILSSFVVEISIGFFSNSLALITDGVHALLDGIVTAILLLATKMASKPPDEKHTYGHGKIESLGGLIGGIAILLIAAFFIFEAINGIQNGNPNVIPRFIAIYAAMYTIGIDIFRVIILSRAIKRTEGVTLKADFYHAFMDLGSTIVVIVGIIFVTLGFYQSDFLAAMILGVLLVYLSLKLIYKTSSDLVDTIPTKMVKQVREIVKETKGVVDVEQILMRKSGEEIFADITITLKGDTSFENAHEISVDVEKNIKETLPNSKPVIHFEPNWDSVSKNSKINDIVLSLSDVKGVHNINTYSSEGEIFASLHVMVDGKIKLFEAHKIADKIEENISREISEVKHITIHLEPFTTIPTEMKLGTISREDIIRIVSNHKEVKKVGKVIMLYFQNIQKIDIECSFDRDLQIEKVHDITSYIEQDIRKKFKNAIITIHPEPN